MMNDIMDDQKVECVDVDGNDTVKLWKFYTEDERKAMENGMWYAITCCVIVQISANTRYNSPVNACNKRFIAW